MTLALTDVSALTVDTAAAKLRTGRSPYGPTARHG